jgi:hypothetical protein
MPARINPATGMPYGNSGINPGGYSNGEYSGNYGDGEYGHPGGGYNVFTPPPTGINVSSEQNPDIGQSQKDLRRMAGELDPGKRADDAANRARELGLGMAAEARANEARRGVSGSGISAYNDRNIASKVMSEAAKAAETAKYGGEELKLNALGQGLNAAQAQANSQFQRQQLQTQAAMQQWQEQMQQQREAQNRILEQMLSGVGGGGLSGGLDLSGAGPAGLSSGPAGPTGNSVAMGGSSNNSANRGPGGGWRSRFA